MFNGAAEKKSNDYIDPKGYWIDPERKLRRMGKQDGEQVVIIQALPECSDAEWERVYEALVACVNLTK